MRGLHTNGGFKALAVALLAVAGCADESLSSLEGLPSEEITGVNEDGLGASTDAVSVSLPAGARLQTTANLNLRTSASTSASIVLTMPNGSSVVTLVAGSPRNGFYNVRYGSYEGWAHGGYMRIVSSTGGGDTGGGTGGTGGGSTGGTAADQYVSTARTGVGFSYWWGHGRWRPEGPTSSTRGSCSGSCPSCSHSGSYGADCSGYIAKIWRVPSSNSDVTVDSHPYSTYSFVTSTGGGQWSRVARDSVRRGDALVYNQNGAGHIFLYESGDAWGSMWAYEARGCSTGIVHNLRTAGSNYSAIRRN